MTTPRVLTKRFWVDQLEPATRSLGAGFFVGAGIEAAQEGVKLTLDMVAQGAWAGASMFALSYIGALAFGPTNGGPDE